MTTTETTEPNLSTKSFPLKFPFATSDGTLVSELKLRRARAADIIAVEDALKVHDTETIVTLAYLASVNGMTLDEVGEIDAEDLVEIGEQLVDFLPSRREAEAPEA